MPRLPSLAFLVALIAASPLASADVLSVRADGSGDFDSLATAVLVAQDGDVLLLDGDFPDEAPLVQDKALVIVGVEGDPPLVGGLQLAGLSAGKNLVVRGLRLGPPTAASFATTSLTVSGCAGGVLVEDCEIRGLDGVPTPGSVDGERAIHVNASHDVRLARCDVTGGDGTTLRVEDTSGGSPVGAGGAALSVLDARVHVAGCTLTGGAGSQRVGGTPGSTGGAGVLGYWSNVWIEGGVVTGGVGGSDCASPAEGCAGGAGVRLLSPLPIFFPHGTLRRRDASITGGMGGALTPPATGTGDAGPDAQGESFAYPGAATLGRASGPIATGDPASLSVQGTPGHSAMWFAALDLQTQMLSGNKGMLLLDLPLLGPYTLGAIPPSGEASFAFTAPSLAGTGVEHLTLHVQAFVIGGGTLRLGGPTAVVHLGDLP